MLSQPAELLVQAAGFLPRAAAASCGLRLRCCLLAPCRTGEGCVSPGLGSPALPSSLFFSSSWPKHVPSRLPGVNCPWDELCMGQPVVPTPPRARSKALGSVWPHAGQSKVVHSTKIPLISSRWGVLLPQGWCQSGRAACCDSICYSSSWSPKTGWEAAFIFLFLFKESCFY